jgi:hypothetical protein
MLFDIMEQHFKRTIGPGRGLRQEVAAVLIPELTPPRMTVGMAARRGGHTHWLTDPVVRGVSKRVSQ